MDPMTLMQLFAHLRQQGQAPQGQMPPMGQGQMPPMQGQMPQQGQTQGQLPPMTPPPQGGMGGQGMGGDPAQEEHHRGRGGINPMMMMGLIPGLLSGGGHGLGSLAPMFGLAGMFGPKLFK